MAIDLDKYFDLTDIVEGVMGEADVSATGTLWGDDVSEKEDAARRYFGIPSDDYIYLILDTTLFGSCKVGLAICTSGIRMKDESGEVRFLDWYDITDDMTVDYDDGTLEIDGSEFFSADGECIIDVIEQARECYAQASAEFDLYGIVDDVMSDPDVSVIGTVWGDDVSDKEDAARRYFGIPSDDEVFLVLDTTLFGSCKVGLALTTSGIHLKDEAGVVRAIEWYELADGAAYSFEDGTLEIDGSQFFSADGVYVSAILDQVCQAL